MKTDEYQPHLHYFAVATACVALLPIVVGALVTTMNWGMAFRDWPTSEGDNMFLYPWLDAAVDKFAEHGHRLAGIVIGLFSIVLTALMLWKEPRRWVRVIATLVLFAVILQGLLGGQRVLLDERLLAMVHGSFAALVFALMVSLALVTGRSWMTQTVRVRDAGVRRLKPLALATSVVIFAQYLLGGLLRHLGTALYEHLAMAVLVLLFVVMTVVFTYRSQAPWLRRPVYALLAVVLLQLSLGAGAWVTKFGFASAGYVAVQHSVPQIVLRTTHTVVGMLLFATSIVYTLRVFRLDSLQRNAIPLSKRTAREGRLSSTFSVSGGVG
jgi:cytochrome c oxidase assembly protein subunit 15